MDVGPIVSRKSEFVPAFSEALKTFTYEKGKTADLGDLHFKVEDHELEAADDPNQSAAKLKGPIGEGSNHSNFSHQSSVKILSKFSISC